MRTYQLMLVLLAFVMPVTAHAGTRVALVVGISSYRELPALENPGRDAAAVAGALRGVGFKVTELNQPAQLTRAALGAALLSFGRQAQGAEAAVVYFAGHGVEVNGANWLLPSDVTAETPDHLQVTAIPAAAAINAVRGASAMRLVILDACRDNPFALSPGWASGRSASATRGLGRESARADNVVLLLATLPGTKADDGRGQGNSPFARALAASIGADGLRVSSLPTMVSRRMRELSGVEQRPDQQGIFDEPDWMFRPGGGQQALIPAPQPQPAAPRPQPPAQATQALVQTVAKPVAQAPKQTMLSLPVSPSALGGAGARPQVLGSGRRVALLIGNASYGKLRRLASPLNDVTLIGSALRTSGFDTVELRDLGRARMDQALQEFRALANGADVAMVYYSGYGMQVLDQDWAMPVDAVVQEEGDVKFEAVSMESIGDALAGARTGVIVFDASRNNPFPNSSSVPTDSVSGAASERLYIFAAAPGQVTTDGILGNSPLARSLATRLSQPGLSASQLATDIVADMAAATGGRQQPRVVSTLQDTSVVLVPSR